MECYSCDIRPVCKVYDAIQTHMHIANITVSNCSIRREDVAAAPAPAIEQPVRPERRPEELASISDQIRNLSTQQEEPAEERSYAECPDCNESYETKEFTACSDCGKNMCVHCAVRANGKVVCEDCYHK